MDTRLSKSITCARSFGLSLRTKLMAAVCSVSSLASMLALLSSKQRHRDRLGPAGEEDDVLLHAVLEDGEVGLLEVCQISIGAVDHGDVE